MDGLFEGQKQTPAAGLAMWEEGVCECHRTRILNRGSGGQGQLDVGFI